MRFLNELRRVLVVVCVAFVLGAGDVFSSGSEQFNAYRSVEELDSRVRHLTAHVDLAFRSAKWGRGFSLDVGLKPVFIYVSGVGIFLFGARDRCSMVVEAIEAATVTKWSSLSGLTLRPLPLGNRVANCDSFTHTTSDQSFGFAPFTVESSDRFGVSYKFFWKGLVPKTELEAAIVSALEVANLDRALLVSSPDLSDDSVRQLIKTIVHESTHLFGQAAWAKEPCLLPGVRFSDCRNWLAERAGLDNDFFGFRPIERELCISASIVACALTAKCSVPSDWLREERSQRFSNDREVHISVEQMLERLVADLNRRTLGRSKILESFWLLSEGVPTYLEGRIEKALGTPERVVADFSMACEKSRLRSEGKRNIHHLYVGAALIEGFTHCLGDIEEEVQFSNASLWSKDGLTWYDTLINRLRRQGCVKSNLRRD